MGSNKSMIHIRLIYIIGTKILENGTAANTLTSDSVNQNIAKKSIPCMF